ncbi:MAG: hypothetical protein HKN79_11365 [Flavobacteriales bacterium]|nr:hypothetical protein [Flavobacteriales bacterium]
METIVYLTEITALISLWYFHRKRGSARTSILLTALGIVLLTDTLLFFDWFPSAEYVVINLGNGFQMILYMFFFLSLMRHGTFIRTMIIYLIGFTIYWMVDSLFFHSIVNEIQYQIYVFGAAGVLIFILAYVHQDLLKSHRAIPVFHRYLLWISGALFFYLAIEIPIFTMINYMMENDVTEMVFPIFQLQSLVAMVYYLTYSTALLWAKTV